MTTLPAALLAGYIFLLPFHRVWTLPWFGSTLQPPEIAFLGLAAASSVMWWRRGVRWRFAFADAAVAAWVGAHLLALLLADAPRASYALTETLGMIYLAALYAAVRITATPRLLDRVAEWFGWSAAIAAALGIAGAMASWSPAVPVPYLGNVPRAQALTAGPQMLASILLMAVPLFVGARMKRGWRRRDVACVTLLALGLLATVSKTALCLAAALSVMWACAPQAAAPSRARVWTAAGVSISIALMLAIGSRVVVMREANVHLMTSAQLVGGQPLASFEWQREAWVVMPTTYAFNNHASLLAIRASWPAGVGPAGQPVFASSLQRERRFPSSIWITTPHSIYLGTAAELGLAGLASLALLLAAGGIVIRRLLAGPIAFRWEAAAYAGAGTAFLIEAISTDLLSCRHYWLLLALMVARERSLPAPARVG
jgi:hypothetical protein